MAEVGEVQVSEDASSKMQQDNKSEGSSLYVSNLTRNIRVGHLKEIFGHYGKVKVVDLPVDRRNGAPRNY
eukprot:gene34342-41570_t